MLCKNTQRIASWTWATLRTARKHESKIGEESITDFLVLELKKRANGSYYINSFTRPKERVTGADWELWFTGLSGKWLGLRVQAKVISIDSRRYSQLHYKRSDGTSQIDQLVADANKHYAIPLYCLYSYWKASEAGKLTWPCGSFKKNSRLFGASWISVRDVKRLKPTGTNDLKSITKLLHPFHCVFCCGGYGGVDLPTRAEAFLKGADYVSKRSSLLVESPPHYVTQLIQRSTDSAEFADVNDPNLYRVTVVRDYGTEKSISVMPDVPRMR
jgi:hypothetical protein